MSVTISRGFFWLYLFFLVVTMGTITNPADPDLWHLLATGEYFMQSGHFPLYEVFSYRSDIPGNLDHEAGGAVLFYLLYQTWGGAALVLLKVACLGATVAFIVLAAGAGGNRGPIIWTLGGFYTLVILCLLPSFQSTVRCMMFSHLFLAIYIYFWTCERRGTLIPRWIYAAVMLAWVNLHGGFILGFLWLGTWTVLDFILGTNWRRRLGIVAVCGIASLCNPWGWLTWVKVFAGIVAKRDHVDEWHPIAWGDPSEYIIFKILVAMTVLTVLLHLLRRGWMYTDKEALGLLFILTAPAFLAARNTSIFAVACGAIGPLLWRWTPSSVGDSAEENLTRLGRFFIAASGVVFSIFWALHNLERNSLCLSYPEMDCPVAAVHFLKARDVEGRLLVPFNYSSYALWILRGQMRVSIDGRYELAYSQKNISEQAAFFAHQPGGENVLQTPPPDAILLPKEAHVYPVLQQDKQWVEAYHDDVNAVFLRR